MYCTDHMAPVDLPRTDQLGSPKYWTTFLLVVQLLEVAGAEAAEVAYLRCHRCILHLLVAAQDFLRLRRIRRNPSPLGIHIDPFQTKNVNCEDGPEARGPV